MSIVFATRGASQLVDAREPSRKKLFVYAATSAAAIAGIASTKTGPGKAMTESAKKKIITTEAIKLGLNGLALLAF